MLSLAQKAGKLKSGEFQVEGSVKEGKSFLVIVAVDASERSKKDYRNMCDYYEVPLYIHGDKEQLGQCIGKEMRVAISVNDEGFAKSLIQQLNQEGLPDKE
ncbi:MAG: ribosomal L7Ae/L30e/S12e/Gadd45 family protein [Lachnospiraceae bacterium]|nr:ribosomal L7Ae/L30e/S12e/Gadd45 family protein [Lachnospiraceae bacterium]